jgi:hypothetical protein
MQTGRAYTLIAAGPVFRGTTNTTRRRAVLIETGGGETGPKTFLIAVQIRDVTNRAKARLRPIAKTAEATHAARIFCDTVLDQARVEDEISEREGRLTRPLSKELSA